MSEYLRKLARAINKAIGRWGIQIVPTRHVYGNLDIYPEKVRPATPLYINIGAGSFFHPFWHNMDTPNLFYANVQKGHIHISYDLKSGRPFPLKSDSLKVAYISHVVEHLSDDCVRFCCAEVHRCLQPGGYFRLACPDIDLEYDAYCRGDATLFPWPTPWGTLSTSIEQRFLEHFATALTLDHPETRCHKFADEEIRDVFSKYGKEDALGYFVNQIPAESKESFPEHHVNWFNVKKLSSFLENAGFENIYESRYGQSKCAFMRNTQLFDSTVPSLSFYMECQK
jgi:predicted SAM-dependent methyltransferase